MTRRLQLMIEIKWNQMSPPEISNSIQISLQKDEARDISKLFQTFVTGFLGVGGWGIKWHCASNFHKRWCHFGQRTRSTEPLNFVPVAQMIIVINVLRSYLLDARNKNFTPWARWTLAATFSWMSHVDKDRFCSWGDRATGSWCDNDTDQ